MNSKYLPNLMDRIDEPELMDNQVFPVPVMQKTLQFLEITNKFFGGYQVMDKYLTQWSTEWEPNQNITILDVGTGAADIPIHLTQWAQKMGKKIYVTGIDVMPEIIEIAKEKTNTHKNILIEHANFFDLEKKNIQFDYVIASLFLHHMPEEKLVDVLRAINAIAKRGLIISDLRRTQPSYISVSLLSQLIGNHIVKHDAPLSVRRSFNIHELAELTHRAGLDHLSIQDEPWFRISITGEKK